MSLVEGLTLRLLLVFTDLVAWQLALAVMDQDSGVGESRKPEIFLRMEGTIDVEIKSNSITMAVHLICFQLLRHCLLKNVTADRKSRSLASITVTSMRYGTNEVGFQDPKCQGSVS